jgi:hypothetical protein
MDTVTDDTDLAFRRHMDERLERTKTAAKTKKQQRKEYRAKQARLRIRDANLERYVCDQQKQCTRTPALFKFFRSVTSHVQFGIWNGPNGWPTGTKKEIRQPNTADRIVASCNRYAHLKNLSNKQYHQHLEKDITLYFCTPSSTKDRYGLIYIDIDVQKKLGLGTTAGALKFVDHLKTFWPNLHHEPSSQGKGIGAWLVVHKEYGESAETFNEALDHLQLWLGQQADLTAADIEMVEVMGHALRYVRDENGKVVDVRLGKVGLLPRQVGVMDTTIVTVKELSNLKVDDQCRHVVEKTEDHHDDTATTPNRYRQGSLSLVKDHDLDQLPRYERIAAVLMGNKNMETSSRAVATAEDLAILMMIGKVVSAAMNRDGTLPGDRIKGLWTTLYQAGQVERGFCPNRFFVLRNLLTDIGLLTWEDERYDLTSRDGKGQACQWHGNEALLLLLETDGVQEIHQTTPPPLQITHLQIRPRSTRPVLVRGLRWRRNEPVFDLQEAEERLDMLWVAA